MEESLDLNLYEMEFRLYDPAIARFTSIDPLAEERDWLTPYNFVQNNPVTRIDPSGLLDDYGLDQDGYVTLLQKTNDNFDRLYSVTTDDDGNLVKDDNGEVIKNDTDGDGAVSENDYVQVDKDNPESETIISDLSTKTAKGNSYGTTKSVDDAVNVFKFAVDNSNVEWSLSNFSNGTNLLNTKHLKSRVTQGERLGLSGLNINTLRLGMHSHPNGGVKGPSAQERLYSAADNFKIQLSIYHKGNQTFYPYSKRQGIVRRGVKKVQTAEELRKSFYRRYKGN